MVTNGTISLSEDLKTESHACKRVCFVKQGMEKKCNRKIRLHFLSYRCIIANEVFLMDYNFHSHTYLCGHATGTEREYIEAAISAGIKEWGFSDHIPFIFPNGQEDGHRVPLARVQEYIDTVNSLKEEYKEKINIHLGFEMEYYPEYFDEMVKAARNWGAEYLILGQHSVGREPYDFVWCVYETDDEALLCDYVQRVTDAIKSGKISFVAHPDIFNFIGDEDIYNREMIKIIKTAEKYNVPLEINFLGIRDRRHYPMERFWSLAQGYDISVIFGFDSHDVEGAKDLNSLSRAMEICKKYNLKAVEKPKLIKL